MTLSFSRHHTVWCFGMPVRIRRVTVTSQPGFMTQQIRVWSYLKLIKAQQVKVSQAYENTKEKVHSTNAAIWLNKMCPLYHPTTSYIKITIDGHNQECCKTKKAATTYRTNKKLELLYKKNHKNFICILYFESNILKLNILHLCTSSKNL